MNLAIAYRGYQFLKRKKVWKIVVALSSFLILALMVLQISLLFMLGLGSISSVLSGDEEIKQEKVDSLPKDLFPHYQDAGKEYNVDWILIMAIHYVQTSFSPTSSVFYKDSFNLPDQFWEGNKESKARVNCLKTCDKCDDAESHKACVDNCMKIKPDRKNMDDVMYTVAEFLGGVNKNNDIMLDQSLLSIVGTPEKMEKTKMMWRYFTRLQGGPVTPGVPDPGQPLPPEEIISDLKLAIALAGVDEASWLPGMQVLVMKESSGNPLDYNPIAVWYSTQWGYQHAAGLCQLMPPTFTDYKLQGHDQLWDPVDNSIASIRYIISKYGHVNNIPNLFSGHYIGY
ncbi:MAG TPA: transglycosylase SLT domain-containing protein [Bacillota bacterium]|nr:transglycosylase SLT domain-containing protein [Bacillota bacterium]